MEPLNDLVSLAIPFIALIIFVGMGENLIQLIETLIKREFPAPISFSLLTAIFFLILRAGDWNFFSYLDIRFTPEWIGYAMSALMVAAGSKFLERKFDLINAIPSLITGIQVHRMRSKKEKELVKKQIEEEDKFYNH